MKKTILVTGSNGQLATQLREIVGENTPYLFVNKKDLDITNYEELKEYFKHFSFELVINCAGYTQVDNAENETDNCLKINHLGVKNIIKVCEEFQTSCIQISTDYVFDGLKNSPYTEQDTPNPINTYGQSKVLAENVLNKSNINYIIIRTSWLYSIFYKNFVKSILNLAKIKNEIQVVYDQIGTPTSAYDLAKFIHFLVQNKHYKNKREIYHFSNEGVCSWYDLAYHCLHHFGLENKLKPCLSENYNSKAKRPKYSILDKSKVKKDFNYPIYHWQKSLQNILKSLKI